MEVALSRLSPESRAILTAAQRDERLSPEVKAHLRAKLGRRLGLGASLAVGAGAVGVRATAAAAAAAAAAASSAPAKVASIALPSWVLATGKVVGALALAGATGMAVGPIRDGILSAPAADVAPSAPGEQPRAQRQAPAPAAVAVAVTSASAMPSPHTADSLEEQAAPAALQVSPTVEPPAGAVEPSAHDGEQPTPSPWPSLWRQEERPAPPTSRSAAIASAQSQTDRAISPAQSILKTDRAISPAQSILKTDRAISPPLAATPSSGAPPWLDAPPRPSQETPSGQPVATDQDDLFTEIATLRTAQAALRGGAPGQALELIARAESARTRLVLGEEFVVTRILAYCALGREQDARRLAANFLLQHPRSPLSERVRSSCAHPAIR